MNDAGMNIDTLRSRARRRLPRPVFDLIDGGADDEITLARNRSAFAAAELLPAALARPGERDTATTVLGHRVRTPVLLAPTGAARVCHRDGELAVAGAARDRGTVYVHGMVSSVPCERIGPGQWFQLYPWGDHGAVAALLDRVAAAGFGALVVTVDSPVFGNRERDRRNGLSVPIRFTPRTAARCATRPRWLWEVLRGAPLPASGLQRSMLRSLYPVTAADLTRLRAQWRGPLVVKGVLRAADCAALLDCGVDGVIVSNHGGRQLDRAPASIDALAPVVAAVGGRAEVLLDGGIRRGTDVLTALAAGARAVLIGRPYLYGLAAGGRAGVVSAIDVLTAELDRTMALTGCATVADIDHGVLTPETLRRMHGAAADVAGGELPAARVADRQVGAG